MRSLLGLTPHPVIASGGVGTLADLRALAALSLDEVVAGGGAVRVAGVIVGKALVEGRFSVEEAVAACTPSA
jgi:phosphoribosylformimino-5-aminoimidazole carboxamide ribonucleotide (ProFAR) isomerase